MDSALPSGGSCFETDLSYNPHLSQNSRAFEIQTGAVRAMNAQNVAVEAQNGEPGEPVD